MTDQRQPSDELQDLLARSRETGIPPWHPFDAATARAKYRERALALPSDDVTPVHEITTTTIATLAGDIETRLYRGSPEPDLPIVVYVHGGGWTVGDLDTHDEICRRLASGAGCLVVAPAYRLAPEHPFPAPLDDVMAVYTWVTTRGAELGGDPARVAVGGDSAGATLTAGLALRLRDDGVELPSALLLFYPATVARFDAPSYHRNADGYLLTRADGVWFWANYLGRNPTGAAWSVEQIKAEADLAAGPEGWPASVYACPGMADDLSGLPPTLVVIAGFDPLHDEGEVFAQRLRASGVDVELMDYDDMTHGFVAMPMPIPTGIDAVERALRWLDGKWRPRR